MSIYMQLKEVFKAADGKLWLTYKKREYPQNSRTSDVHLVFPKMRNGTIRMSEQEARLACVESIMDTNMRYAIETPTMEMYSFTNGGLALSASTDLTIYENDMTKTYNIEFKSKGSSPGRGDHRYIGKDFQKLLREKPPGLWFHLLESVNNSTLPNLLEVMAEEVHKVLSAKTLFKIKSPTLLIHVCVLKHQFSIEKPFDVKQLRSSSLEQIKDQFSIDLTVSRTQLLQQNSVNGWSINP